MFNIIKLCFTDSEKLFKTVKNRSFEQDFKYFALVLLLPLMFTLVVAAFLLNMFFIISNLMPSGIRLFNVFWFFGFFGPLALFGAGLAVYALFLVGAFIASAAVHFGVQISGGKGKYEKTYKAYVYGTTPFVVFFWLPFINFVFFLWSWYLNVKGLSKFHKMPANRAFFATLLPVLTMVAVFVVLMY
ncbi:MAG: hypothetical protein DRP13_01500 [Candidatus Aenigmatarchaeota archaeon]|nr:MAG: hypothetical protein DRP13_01500 [Candidatus Aenigmarchaeota archaeon]